MRNPTLIALAFASVLAVPSPARASAGVTTAQLARPVSAPAPAARDDAAGEKEERRILRLASGQTIRVLARQKDGAWEYKGKKGWERLDPRIVLGAELERDVLRAWREKRDAAEKGARTVDGRVELARWAAESGLATEALAELDGVLEAAPDHTGALAVLGAQPLFSVPSVEVPAGEEAAARAELLRFGSGLPRAAREIAVAELGRSADREGLRADLARDLWSSIVVRRSFAALALRRIFPGEEVKPLLVHAVRDASETVRGESARALRAAQDPALVLPLVRALDSPSLAIRSNAATALGEMGFPAAVEPLIARLAAALQASSDARAPHSHIFTGRQIAYIQDFDVEVAQFQAVADPQVNVLLEGQVTEAAVIGSREESVAIEAVAIRKALEKLVHERPGGTAREWLKWWEKNASKWRSADHAAPATGAR